MRQLPRRKETYRIELLFCVWMYLTGFFATSSKASIDVSTKPTTEMDFEAGHGASSRVLSISAAKQQTNAAISDSNFDLPTDENNLLLSR